MPFGVFFSITPGHDGYPLTYPHINSFTWNVGMIAFDIAFRIRFGIASGMDRTFFAVGSTPISLSFVSLRGRLTAVSISRVLVLVVFVRVITAIFTPVGSVGKGYKLNNKM